MAGTDGVRTPSNGTNHSASIEDHDEEVLVGHPNDAVGVGVLVSERVGQLLQRDAQVNEIVEIDRALAILIVLSHHQHVEVVAQTVAERAQRLSQFHVVD